MGLLLCKGIHENMKPYAILLLCIVGILADNTGDKLGKGITSCRKDDGKLRTNGDYQSYISCNVYATCVDGYLIDNRPCPAGLKWDDFKKICTYNSDTCS